ncbi:MAG TPA: ATP-binding protein [Acidobacteriota bacterium]
MVSLNEKIAVPGDMSGVDQALLFLKGLAGRLNLSEELAYYMELAVSEACINIIRYAYAESRGEIHLSAWLKAGRIYFEIRDSGRYFDPREVEPPDLDRYIREGVKGGFGVFLMRRLMDGLDYRREEGENVLTLWKALSLPGSPETF